jgi:hypothetical protein
MNYYRTQHSDVIAAWVDFESQSKAVKAAAREFGELFGGRGRVAYTVTCSSFAGVSFKPAMPTDIWTVPDTNDLQRPRAVPRAGTTKERKDELKQIRELWISRLPKQRAEPEAFYKSMGADWGVFLFAGLTYFCADDTLYVGTTAKLNGCMTEILGSEFHRAKESLAVAA